jgi:multicomponent Na+:H+ antiporter subunit E
VKSRLAYAVPLFVVLLVTWVLLQGQLTVGNVVGGLLLAFALVVVFPISADAVHHELHPWGFLKFIVFVLYSLVMSSWAVIKIILRPTPTALRAAIVRVRLEQESPVTTTLVANAVTLTPGTMTLTARIHPAELHIHGLGIDDLDEFRAEIHDLERRTVEALTPVYGPDAPTDDPDGAGEPTDGGTA